MGEMLIRPFFFKVSVQALLGQFFEDFTAAQLELTADLVNFLHEFLSQIKRIGIFRLGFLFFE